MSTMKVRARAVKALEDARGRCTASALVEAASNKKHPLHGDFEWDDAVAAHEYRLVTARHIIASVRVTVTAANRTVTSVGYVRDPAAGRTAGYVSVPQLRTERDNAQEVLLAEMTMVASRLERAKELAAVLELEGLDELISGVASFASRVRRGSASGEAAAVQ